MGKEYIPLMLKVCAGKLLEKEDMYHLSISEGGDACKNSIKRGEAMTPVMCIRILWQKLVMSLIFEK